MYEHAIIGNTILFELCIGKAKKGIRIFAFQRKQLKQIGECLSWEEHQKGLS